MIINKNMYNEIITPIKIRESDDGIELEFDYMDVWNKLNTYRSKNTNNPDNIVVEMPRQCKLFGIPVIFKTSD